MALEILYSPAFADSLEAILNYYDERNGSDTHSKKLFKMVHEQISKPAYVSEYDSDTYKLVSEGVADMHCRSDEYLADELLLELQEKK